MRVRGRSLWVAVAVAAASHIALAQERDRAKIPDRFKWDLGDIYRNEAAWRAGKDKLTADIQSLGGRGGLIAVSPGGDAAWGFTTPAMYRGLADAGGRTVAIYSDEESDRR